MDQTTQDFFHDFRQDLLAGAEAKGSFQLDEFMETISSELIDTGVVEGFELCHYRAQRGMRIDGYWFNDDGVLDLFIADFDSRATLKSLTKTDIKSIFKRATNFLVASIDKELFFDLEVTSPEYSLSRQLYDRKSLIRRIEVFLLSERALSSRVGSIDSEEKNGIKVNYNIWDILRLKRQSDSKGQKEALDLDFLEMFGKGVSCLPANIGNASYNSYLVVIPGSVLAKLYGQFGARLLEQNVRCFLQARGKVNKGIRNTIINEPQMFFAYNNGLTATAQEVSTVMGPEGLQIAKMKDLQIVNGGQTTASLFHTLRKDKTPLDEIFVQMKLAVIDNETSEKVVPLISEYANTQNKVNAADFFSNHPFHIRIEDISRRVWVPAQKGAQRETKWFYERARGQYADAHSQLTKREQAKFKAENPKPQMFSKTDLAKFENVWDEHPRWVNLGAQKNFAQYASRIGKEWDKSSNAFNEYYFRRIVARALIFRKTEKLVSGQPWYNGGYRANIVAYAIAVLSEICNRYKKNIDYLTIWSDQSLPEYLEQAIILSAEFVNETIVNPPPGISNISEWCKKEVCWSTIQNSLSILEDALEQNFWKNLVSKENQKKTEKDAVQTQKMDNGIEAQKTVVNIPAQDWMKLKVDIEPRKVLSPKELGILELACQIPTKIPSEKQSLILMEIIEKAKEEGIHLTL